MTQKTQIQPRFQRFLKTLGGDTDSVSNVTNRYAKTQVDTALERLVIEQRKPEYAKSMLASQVEAWRASASNIALINLYRTSSVANACANFWANNIAAIKFRLYDPDGQPVDHREKPGDMDWEAGDDESDLEDEDEGMEPRTQKKPKKPERDNTEVMPLAQMLASAAFHDQIRKVELTLRYFGSSMMRRLQNKYGITKEVKWVNPVLYTRNLDAKFMGLKGFWIYPGRGQDNPYAYIPLEKAVYFTEFSFEDDYEGVSSVEIVAQQAATEPEMATTLLALFRNMATPIGVLQPAQDTKNYVNKNEVGALTRFFQTAIQGARNFGRTLITPSRWEWLPLSVNFKDLDMGSMKRDLRDEIATAFNIEPAFLSSGQSQYNELEGKISIWLDRHFRPRADFYARTLTQQLCADFPGYEIRADISELVKEDEALRLANVSQKLTSMLITVAQGQEQLGQTPDPVMRGIYMISGVPVPAKHVRDYWQNLLFRGNTPTAGGESGGDGGDNGGGGSPRGEGLKPNAQVDPPSELQDKRQRGVAGEDFKPHAVKPAEARSADPLPTHVTDAVIRELEVAATKAYKSQGFEAKHIHEATWMYVQSLTEWLVPENATKSMWYDDIKASVVKYAKAHHIRMEKAGDTIQATRLMYEERVNEAYEDAFYKRIDIEEFGKRLRAASEDGIDKVFVDGLYVGGVKTNELDEEENLWVTKYKASQVQWYEKAMLDMKNGKYTEKMLKNRGQEWFHKTLYPAYTEGIYSASKNIALMWFQGRTEKPCKSCTTLNGQVRRAKSWKKQQLRPKIIDLNCRGFECDCQLLPTDESVTRGRFPEWRFAKSEHVLQPLNVEEIES